MPSKTKPPKKKLTTVRLFFGGAPNIGSLPKNRRRESDEPETASFEVDESAVDARDLEGLIAKKLNSSSEFLVWTPKEGEEKQLNFYLDDECCPWYNIWWDQTLDADDFPLKKGGPLVKKGEFGIHVYHAAEFPAFDTPAFDNLDEPRTPRTMALEKRAFFIFSRPSANMISPDEEGGWQTGNKNMPLAYPASFPAVRFIAPEGGLVFYEEKESRAGLSANTAENVAPRYFCVEEDDHEILFEKNYCVEEDDWQWAQEASSQEYRENVPVVVDHDEEEDRRTLVDGRCRWTGRELLWYPSNLLKPETTYRVSVNLEVFRKDGLAVRGCHITSSPAIWLEELEENGKYFRFHFRTRAAEPLVLKVEDENGRRRVLRYYSGESYEGLKAAVARRLGVGVERVLGLSVVPKICKDVEVAGDVVDDMDVLDLQEGDLIRVEWRDEDAEVGEEKK